MTLVECNRIRSRILKARKRGTLIKRNKAVDLVELYIEQLAKLKALKKSILANVKWKEENGLWTMNYLFLFVLHYLHLTPCFLFWAYLYEWVRI
jgi:hypothetical protein